MVTGSNITNKSLIDVVKTVYGIEKGVSQEEREATFHRDLLDLKIEAVKTIQLRKDSDGNTIPTQGIDYESLYWETRDVDSPSFSRFVLKLKTLQKLGYEARHNMMPERAKVIEESITMICKKCYQFAIDAKASESIRPDHTAKGTFVDKIARHRVERAYSAKDKAAKGFLRSFIQKDEERDS